MMAASLQELINTPLEDITDPKLKDPDDPKKKLVIKRIPEGLLAMLRRQEPSEFSAVIASPDEYRQLVACQINYTLKPSPFPFDDIAAATDALLDHQGSSAILGLLESLSTHVMKAVNSSLPGLMIIDQSPIEAAGIGLCKDTLGKPTSFSIGGNAGYAAMIPFWCSNFTFWTGEIMSNLSAFLGFHGKEAQTSFEEVLISLGASDLLIKLNDIRNSIQANPIPDVVAGKEVIFPLDGSACDNDQYLVITPVPSATTMCAIHARYYADRNLFFKELEAFNTEQKAHEKAENAYRKLKKKDGVQPPVFEASRPAYPLPKMGQVVLVASNPANLGSAMQKISGKPIAFEAKIAENPFRKTQAGRKRLTQNLLGKYHSLVTVKPFLVDFLTRENPTSELRARWSEELSDHLVYAILDLITLRHQGLPVAEADVALKAGSERRFITRTLSGDLLKRSLTSADIQELATAVTETINLQVMRRKNSLGMSNDCKSKVFDTLSFIFRKAA